MLSTFIFLSDSLIQLTIVKHFHSVVLSVSWYFAKLNVRFFTGKERVISFCPGLVALGGPFLSPIPEVTMAARDHYT